MDKEPYSIWRLLANDDVTLREAGANGRVDLQVQRISHAHDCVLCELEVLSVRLWQNILALQGSVKVLANSTVCTI